jgi:hypothetical protein
MQVVVELHGPKFRQVITFDEEKDFSPGKLKYGPCDLSHASRGQAVADI